MNDFEYIIAIKELDSFKTLKAYDEYIRRHVKTLENMYVSSHWSVSSSDVSSASKLYRCITKARNNYKNYKNLPDYITRYVRSVHTILFEAQLEANVPLSMFWKTFENDDTIILPRMGVSDLALLSDYIKDTEIGIPFRYHVCANSIGTGIKNDICDTGIDARIASVEVVKAARDKPYRETVLEDCLSQRYTTLTTPISKEEVDSTIDILTRALTSIKERQ